MIHQMLISASSAFSKPTLYILSCSVHILLKPSLKDFEHYLASMWNEPNCVIVWAFFGIALLCDWNDNSPFPILWPPLSFPNLMAYGMQHFHSIFRIWTSSTGIPSPPIALFIVMLPKAPWLSHSRMSSSMWVITPSWLPGSWRSFLYSFSVYSCHLFLISYASF